MADRGMVVKCYEFCLLENKCSTDCPYWDNKATTDECTEELAKDVLTLLKEQESHLMTAEEVQNVDLWEFCYLEEKRLPGNEYRTACGEYKLFCATWPRITQAKQEHGMENYGKTWRCWTAGNATRPSLYDRKHTAWG